jgi:acyl-CoA synthetase (AMP-forming)/AMP-acid ligase II
MAEGAAEASPQPNATGYDWDKLAASEPTFPSFLTACANAYRDLTMIVVDDERMTFGEADAHSADLARALLAQGIGKGSRVGLIMQNRPDFAVIFFAVARIGAVVVPISTLSTTRELGRIINHADLSILISSDRYLSHDYVERLQTALGLDGLSPPLALTAAPFLRDIRIVGARQASWSRPLWDEHAPRVSPAILQAAERSVAPADAVTIIYTSGSTAEPKGVIHSHAALVRQARKLAANLPHQKGEIQVAASPLFWVGGLMTGLMQMMPVGAACVFTQPRASAILEAAERERANYIHTWPHVARQIANHPSFPGRDLSAVRGGSVMEAIPPHLRKPNQEHATALGMSETMGPHTRYVFELPDDMIGSFGPPACGMEHRIVDIETRKLLPDGEAGELEVRGDTLMIGYVGKERGETFTPDGWFPTGDRCRLHNGQVFFLGRVDDMIKCAGANVSPREVEAALRALPGVDAAHVTAIADVARITSVAAAVVLEPGAGLTVADIRAHAKRTLSSYKVPRLIRICAAEDLPMTGSAKIDRRGLAALLEKTDHEASGDAT